MDNCLTHCNISDDAGYVSNKYFWKFSQNGGLDINRKSITGKIHCKKFQQEIWFELVKTMGIKHISVFDEKLRCVKNDTTKTFEVRILNYAEHLQNIYNIACYIYPISKKGKD